MLLANKILYSTRRFNIKIYFIYKKDNFVIIKLTNVLYISVDMNLLSTIRLVRKYIKVYLIIILEPIKLVKDSNNFEYIDTKINLYFLRISRRKL